LPEINLRASLRFRNQKDNRTSSYRSKLAIVNSTTVSELLYSFRIFKISTELFSIIPCALTGICHIGLTKSLKKILGPEQSTSGKVKLRKIRNSFMIAISPLVVEDLRLELGDDICNRFKNINQEAVLPDNDYILAFSLPNPIHSFQAYQKIQI